MLNRYSNSIAAAVSRGLSKLVSRLRSIGNIDDEHWDDDDVPEIKIFDQKVRDINLLSWLTPEKLFVTKDVLILSLDAPDPQEGLVARCYPDGQLKFLGVYKGGTCDRYWSMTLEHGVEKGVARGPSSKGISDYETFNNGHSDRNDAWSDNIEPYPMDYDVWVRSWVKHIAGDVKAT